MSRLIDADALLEHVWRDRLDSRERIAELVKFMPTIEERKTGRWTMVTDNNGQHFVCDQCGEWKYRQGQRFCGECGTRMDGDEE